jgi:CheY-like chemotaxis protein
VSDQLAPQILHVDDDGELLEQVKSYLEGEDIPDWGRPEVHSTESFHAALQILEERRIDLVILDVRNGGHEATDIPPDEEAGARTLEEIKARRFVPVLFWTALPDAVSDLAGSLVKVGKKDDDLEILKVAVDELFATGLPTLNRALRHLVEEEQRAYMWGYVADHWDELRAGNDPVGLAYLLVRRLGRSLSGPGVVRVAEQLGAAEGGAPADGTIHAAEMYVLPPLPDTRPGVSEIVREGEGVDARWWFVLTPSCDLEHPEKGLDRVFLARCILATEDRRVARWLETDSNSSREKVEELVSHKTGNQHDRWLFLPSAPTLPDLVVDFQALHSVELTEFENMIRVGSLASPFAEAALNRFGRYIGRVGTDDLDVEALMARLKAKSA